MHRSHMSKKKNSVFIYNTYTCRFPYFIHKVIKKNLFIFLENENPKKCPECERVSPEFHRL